MPKTTKAQLGLKVEIWTEDEIRLGHRYVWLPEDATPREWAEAVRQLGAGLRSIADASDLVPPTPPEGA